MSEKHLLQRLTQREELRKWGRHEGHGVCLVSAPPFGHMSPNTENMFVFAFQRRGVTSECTCLPLGWSCKVLDDPPGNAAPPSCLCLFWLPSPTRVSSTPGEADDGVRGASGRRRRLPFQRRGVWLHPQSAVHVQRRWDVCARVGAERQYHEKDKPWSVKHCFCFLWKIFFFLELYFIFKFVLFDLELAPQQVVQPSQ